MKNIFILISIAFFTSTNFLLAQESTPVFPELSEQDLYDAVRAEYTPATVLNYSQARDRMFGEIYNVNNRVSCVYTGFSVYISPNGDPSDEAFRGGADDGLNTEHTYPQSKGAEYGSAKSNLHHLFPTLTPVNGARGSDPFADIPDNSTDTWYRLDQARSSIPPASTRDEYSEDTSNAFEPREDHKGNVARAMFYFYTIYRSQANSADPNYFEPQRETLLKWHQQDPVDQEEYDRTFAIANFQDGKVNPFILDTLLAYRMYCRDMSGTCDVDYSVSAENNEALSNSIAIFPNPVSSNFYISFNLEEAADVSVECYDKWGRKVQVLEQGFLNLGSHQIEMNLSDLHLPSGFYYLRILVKDNNRINSAVKKIFVK